MNIRHKVFSNLLVILILAITVSCTNPFNPEMKKPDNSFVQYDSSSPNTVLENLENAYNRKDLNLYLSCFSDSFKFVLIATEQNIIGVDADNDGISDSWWGLEQEKEYHRNLFGTGSTNGEFPSPDNISLNLKKPPSESWQKSNEKGMEDVIIIPCYFDLRLSFNSIPDIVANGHSHYYLKKEGENWKIIRWIDDSTN